MRSSTAVSTLNPKRPARYTMIAVSAVKNFFEANKSSKAFFIVRSFFRFEIRVAMRPLEPAVFKASQDQAHGRSSLEPIRSELCSPCVREMSPPHQLHSTETKFWTIASSSVKQVRAYR